MSAIPRPRVRAAVATAIAVAVAGLTLGLAHPAHADPPLVGAIRVTNVVVGTVPGGSTFAVGIFDASGGTCDLDDVVANAQFSAAGSVVLPAIPVGTYCWLEIAAPGIPIVDHLPSGFFTVAPGEVQDLVVTNTYTDPLVGTNVRVWVQWIDGAIDDDNPASVGVDPSAYVLHVRVEDAAGGVTDDRSCSYLDQATICPTLLLPVGGSIHVSQTGVDDFELDQADFAEADCFMYADGGCGLQVVNRRIIAEPPAEEPDPTTSTTTPTPTPAAETPAPTEGAATPEVAGAAIDATPADATLPRTGSALGPLAAIGVGLVGLGQLARRRSRRLHG